MGRKLFLSAFVCVLALVVQAAPSEAAGFHIDRATWNQAMRWINFGILVFVLVKYLKEPLVGFIRDKQNATASIFESLKERAEKLEEQRREQNELLAQMEKKIEKITAYYHEVGAEEKRRILTQAEALRKQILADAEAATLREFEEAKKRFRAEVVDMAIQLAEERLRKKITQKDHKRLVDGYLAQLGAM